MIDECLLVILGIFLVRRECLFLHLCAPILKPHLHLLLRHTHLPWYLESVVKVNILFFWENSLQCLELFGSVRGTCCSVGNRRCGGGVLKFYCGRGLEVKFIWKPVVNMKCCRWIVAGVGRCRKRREKTWWLVKYTAAIWAWKRRIVVGWTCRKIVNVNGKPSRKRPAACASCKTCLPAFPHRQGREQSTEPPKISPLPMCPRTGWWWTVNGAAVESCTRFSGGEMERRLAMWNGGGRPFSFTCWPTLYSFDGLKLSCWAAAISHRRRLVYSTRCNSSFSVHAQWSALSQRARARCHADVYWACAKQNLWDENGLWFLSRR